MEQDLKERLNQLLLDFLDDQGEYWIFIDWLKEKGENLSDFDLEDDE